MTWWVSWINTWWVDVMSHLLMNGWMNIMESCINLSIALFSLVCLCFIFKKAGRKRREAIIPFWNLYVLCVIIWKKKRFWLVISIFIIPFIRIISSLIFWFLWAAWGEWELWLVIKHTINWILWIASCVLVIPSLIIMLIIPFRLAKKFWKSGRFGLWLLLLTPIFRWILAFGKSKYKKE